MTSKPSAINLVIVNLPLIALVGLGIALVMSFAARDPRARRRWRIGLAGGAVAMLASCAVVIVGLQGLAA